MFSYIKGFFRGNMEESPLEHYEIHRRPEDDARFWGTARQYRLQ